MDHMQHVSLLAVSKVRPLNVAVCDDQFCYAEQVRLNMLDNLGDFYCSDNPWKLIDKLGDRVANLELILLDRLFHNLAPELQPLASNFSKILRLRGFKGELLLCTACYEVNAEQLKGHYIDGLLYKDNVQLTPEYITRQLSTKRIHWRLGTTYNHPKHCLQARPGIYHEDDNLENDNHEEK